MKNKLNNFVKKYKALLNEYKRVDFRYVYNTNAVLNSVLVFVLMEIIFIGFSYIVKMNANLTYLFLTTSISVISSLLLYHYRMLIRFDLDDRRTSLQMQGMKLVFVQTLFFLIFIFMFKVGTVSAVTIVLSSVTVFTLLCIFFIFDVHIKEDNQMLLSLIVQAFMIYVVFGCCVYLINISNPAIVVVLYTAIAYMIEILRKYTVSVWKNKISGTVCIVVLVVGILFVAEESVVYNYGYTQLIFYRDMNNQVISSDPKVIDSTYIPAKTDLEYDKYDYEKITTYSSYGEEIYSDHDLFDYEALEYDNKIFLSVSYYGAKRVDEENSSISYETSSPESWVFVYDYDLELLESFHYEGNRVFLEIINEGLYMFKETSRLEVHDSFSNYSVFVFNGNDFVESVEFKDNNYILKNVLWERRTFFYDDDTLYVTGDHQELWILEPDKMFVDQKAIIGVDYSVQRSNYIYLVDFEIQNNDNRYLINRGEVTIFDEVFLRGRNLIDDDYIIYIEETKNSNGYRINNGYLFTFEDYIDGDIDTSDLTPVEINNGSFLKRPKMEVIDDFVYIQSEDDVVKYDLNLRKINNISGVNKIVRKKDYFLLDSMVLKIDDTNTLSRLSLEEHENNLFHYSGDEFCKDTNYFHLSAPVCYTNSYGFLQLSYTLLLSLVIVRKKQVIL